MLFRDLHIGGALGGGLFASTVLQVTWSVLQSGGLVKK